MAYDETTPHDVESAIRQRQGAHVCDDRPQLGHRLLAADPPPQHLGAEVDPYRRCRSRVAQSAARAATGIEEAKPRKRHRHRIDQPGFEMTDGSLLRISGRPESIGVADGEGVQRATLVPECRRLSGSAQSWLESSLDRNEEMMRSTVPSLQSSVG